MDLNSVKLVQKKNRLEPDGLFIEFFVHFKKIIKTSLMYKICLFITDIGLDIGLCGLGYTFEGW